MNTFNFAKTQVRHAISLVEVIVSAAILGGVGLLAMNGIATTYQSQLDTADVALADLLARDLMDEILQQSFENTGQGFLAIPFGDTTRSNFVFLDHYHNWNSDYSKPAQEKDGTFLNVGTGWARKVLVTNTASDSIDIETNDDTGIKRVTVIVTRSGRKLAQRVAHKTRYSPPSTLD